MNENHLDLHLSRLRVCMCIYEGQTGEQRERERERETFISKPIKCLSEGVSSSNPMQMVSISFPKTLRRHILLWVFLLPALIRIAWTRPVCVCEEFRV